MSTQGKFSFDIERYRKAWENRGPTRTPETVRQQARELRYWKRCQLRNQRRECMRMVARSFNTTYVTDDSSEDEYPVK